MDFAGVAQIISSAENRLTNVSVSQQAGEICPSATASYIIDPSDIGSTPPTLSVNISGITYSFQAHRSTYNIQSNGLHTRNVTYVLPQFKTLLKGYGQDILFVNCPRSVFDAMNYDSDNLDIKFKESDHYNRSGWTVTQIISYIFSLVGVAVSIDIPDIDVSEPTIQYQASSDLTQFISNLLPNTGGLQFVWTTNASGILNLFLIYPSATTAVQTVIAAENLSFTEEHDSDYDSWLIEGGMSEPILSEYKVVKTQNPVERDLDPETTTITTKDGVPVVTTKTLRKLFDFKNDEFHTTRETVTTTGPVYNNNNEQPISGNTQITVTEYSYENSNSLLYEKSRPVGHTKTLSGYATKITLGLSALGDAVNSKGTGYLLSDEYKTYTYAEYNAIAVIDRPTIIAGTAVAWRDDYRKETEEIAYTQESESTKDIPEGTILKNSTTIEEFSYRFKASGFGYDGKSRYFYCTEDGKSILSDIAEFIRNANEIVDSNNPGSTATLSQESTGYQQTELYTKDIESQAKSTYRWKETKQTLEPETGNYKTEEREVPIPSGRLPAEPTQWRKQKIRYEAGNMGKKQIISAFKASVPTNNRSQFNGFSSLIRQIAQRPLNEISIQHLQTPYFTGEPYYGRIVVGWTAAFSNDGNFNFDITVRG